MIELTVAIPAYKSKRSAWLAMESLCRQKNITFSWEIVVCEEQESEMAGEAFYRSYEERLMQIKCVKIIYSRLNHWVPLSQKWRILAANADPKSKIFVLKAADDYSHPFRLALTYKALIDGKHDWYQEKMGIFYDLITGKLILYNHDLNGPLYKRMASLNKATLTSHARSLPISDKRKGVDNWFLRTIHQPRIIYDTSKSWRYGVFTQGLNVISKKRGKYFDAIRPPFQRCPLKLDDILPGPVIDKLLGEKKSPEVTVIEEPSVPSETADFVYIYAKGPAKWTELLYSVRSVRKNFNGTARIFVVGDDPGIKGVIHIPTELIKGFAYCRAIDVANKLEIISQHPQISPDFVYMYDDIILLKPLYFYDIAKVIAHDLVIDPRYYFRAGKGVMPSERWVSLFRQTHMALSKRSLPTYNYETHLPRVLNKERVAAILNKYNLKNVSLLFNTLYFNNFHSKPDIQLRENPMIKAGIYRPYDNPIKLDSEIKGRWYLNYDDRGLNDLLKKTIINLMK